MWLYFNILCVFLRNGDKTVISGALAVLHFILYIFVVDGGF
jgi:hypothetical protein